jgi:hypothetical protein
MFNRFIFLPTVDTSLLLQYNFPLLAVQIIMVSEGYIIKRVLVFLLQAVISKILANCNLLLQNYPIW